VAGGPPDWPNMNVLEDFAEAAPNPPPKEEPSEDADGGREFDDTSGTSPEEYPRSIVDPGESTA